jgi:phosphoribosylaminoimidazole-succinocarboxamide synthase
MGDVSDFENGIVEKDKIVKMDEIVTADICKEGKNI